MSNIYSLPSFLVEAWIKNKSLPKAEVSLDGYFIVYEEGWEKNETRMQQDMHWFIFKVILAVQKRWKPFSMDIIKNIMIVLLHPMKHLLFSLSLLHFFAFELEMLQTCNYGR